MSSTKMKQVFCCRGGAGVELTRAPTDIRYLKFANCYVHHYRAGAIVGWLAPVGPRVALAIFRN
jgi:hypothetical protein